MEEWLTGKTHCFDIVSSQLFIFSGQSYSSPKWSTTLLNPVGHIMGAFLCYYCSVCNFRPSLDKWIKLEVRKCRVSIFTIIFLVQVKGNKAHTHTHTHRSVYAAFQFQQTVNSSLQQQGGIFELSVNRKKAFSPVWFLWFHRSLPAQRLLKPETIEAVGQERQALWRLPETPTLRCGRKPRKSGLSASEKLRIQTLVLILKPGEGWQKC